MSTGADHGIGHRLDVALPVGQWERDVADGVVFPDGFRLGDIDLTTRQPCAGTRHDVVALLDHLGEWGKLYDSEGLPTVLLTTTKSE